MAAITCPAGEPIHLPDGSFGCRCGIERSSILPSENLRTLALFCLDRYTGCSTWRTMREAEWEDKARRLDREVAEAAPER